MFRIFKNHEMVNKNDSLIGRNESISIPSAHHVSKNSIKGPWPDSCSRAVFGLGCFWGAERIFWQTDGVYVTSVGYAGGYTPNPTYEEVCEGNTGHAEVVEVIFFNGKISYNSLVKLFFESHNPTQGMKQGNDKGTQYRSMILFCNESQNKIASKIKQSYNKKLINEGYPIITTEIKSIDNYYFAESYHQQYLSKNPNGYCGLDGTGIKCI